MTRTASNATPDLQQAYRWLQVACMLALVYGSLLPLEFREQAWADVLRPFLQSLLAVAQHRSRTDWATNLAIFFPLGYLWAAAASQAGSRKGHLPLASSMGIWMACVGLSACIEFMQSFFALRDPSTADILANLIGSACGIAARGMTGAPADRMLSGFLRAGTLPPRLSTGAPSAIVATVVCGAWLALWAGLLTPPWGSVAQTGDRWQSLQWLPFVRHQAANIVLAITSTAMAAAAFAPVGAALWWHGAFAEKSWAGRIHRVAWIAAVVAVLLEACKLVLTTKTPDTGNIVIAALSAGLAFWLSPLVWHRLQGHAGPGQPDADDDKWESTSMSAGALQTTGRGTLFARVGAVFCAVAVVLLVLHYPMAPVALAAGLAVYAIVLLRYPLAWLVVVPALLPVLDLAPWTGWHAVDEFDAVVLTSLAIGLWRLPPASSSARSAGWGFWLPFAGFCVSLLASALIGIWPLHAIDSNALGNPNDSYAGLGLAKALVLACGVAFLFRRQSAPAPRTQSMLGTGVVLGLIGASITVMIERLAYAGLTDYSAAYRAVGMFSTMQTGGAHLDAFLLFAMPFAGIWALQSRQRWQRLFALASIAAGSYAVMMTFSRAAVAALALQTIVIAVYAVRAKRQTRLRSSRMATTSIAIIAMIAILGTIVVPAMLGTFMQSRVAGTDADMQTRSAHWRDGQAMMTDKWPVTLFGMGLGSFARTYQMLGPLTLRPAAHRFSSEEANGFLSIHPGATVYVEQIVSVSPGQRYTVSLRARAHGADGAVNVLLCDRTLLKGYGCQSVSFRWSGDAQTWKPLQATLNSGFVGASILRTSKLSLENAGRSSAVDLDDVKLVDKGGVDHLVNGNFQAGADRWDFSSPSNHLPWQIENMWLEVLFNQGWIGLLLFATMVVATTGRLHRLAYRGDTAALAMFASLLGLLALGAFNSILDAPRLLMVFIGLVAVAGLLEKSLTHRARHTPRTTAPGDPPAQAGNPKPPATIVPALPTVSGAPMQLHAPTSWQDRLRPLAVHLLALSVFLAVLTRLPFVPYNVRELVNPFHPVIATVLLALSIIWIFGLPALGARWLMRAGLWALGFPIVLVAHALVAWVLLRYAVLPESIHDVVGSPVLDWPLDLELMARLVPLLSAVALPLTAGAALARLLTRQNVGLAPVWLVLTFALAMPLQYTAIVTLAATDNLTELMADNASALSFVTLQLYGLLIGTIASLSGSMRDTRGWREAAILVAGLILSLPVGYWLLTSATEPMLIKQENIFSAMQFLFSTDRAHYAQGLALQMRFAVFHVGVILLIAWSQWPFQAPRSTRHAGRRRGATA